MIRLAATSISISESDIHLHLREINIYQSLLQQGFKPKEIRQYYASYRPSTIHGAEQRYKFRADHTHNDADRNPEELELHKIPAKIGYGYESNERTEHFNDICGTVPGRERIEPGADCAQLEAADDNRSIHSSMWIATPPTQSTLPVAQSWPQAAGNIASAYGISEVSDPISPLQFSVKNISRGYELSIPTCVDLCTKAVLPTYFVMNDEAHDNEEFRAATEANWSSETLQLSPNANSPDVETISNRPHLLAKPASYRPRQSSSLYITRNADSPDSSGYSDDSFKSTITEWPPLNSARIPISQWVRTMTYRPRSQTYAWEQSEADDMPKTIDSNSKTLQNPNSQVHNEELHPIGLQAAPSPSAMVSYPSIQVQREVTDDTEPSSIGTHVTTSHHQTSKSTLLRAEAADFIPLKLPPPFSSTRRVSSSQYELPSNSRSLSSSTANNVVEAPSSSIFTVQTPTGDSRVPRYDCPMDGGSAFSAFAEFPSSPPVAIDQDSSLPVGLETKPYQTPVRRSHRKMFQESQLRLTPKSLRTKVRIPRNDGPEMVYDDRIPAHVQPKTPADLARGHIVTEKDVAYTTSPGRMTRTYATIHRYYNGPSIGAVEGEESPSRRVRMMRERRERESRRSAVVEGEIWNRVIGTDGSEGPSSTAESRSSWRDDLAADRVGEENF